MSRSSAILLAMLAFGATDAHAFNWNRWNHHLTPQKRLQQQVRRPTQQSTMRKIETTEEKQRVESVTQLRRTEQRPESPFVRPSRVANTWDTRGLGLTVHTSSIGSTHSIYERLHASPVSIRTQLQISQQSHGGLVTRMLHTSELELGKASFDLIAQNDRRRVYRTQSLQVPPMFAFKRN